MATERAQTSKGGRAAGMRRGTWTAEEDQVIVDSIQEGFTKWSDIGKRFTNERTGKQCRERWFNHLDPTLKRGPWSEDEDHALMRAQARLGNAWTKIATEIPGRSENEVKNRWYSAAIRNRRVAENKMDAQHRKKRRLDADTVSDTTQVLEPAMILSPDDQVSYRIAEIHLPTMLQAYKGTAGVTSAESSTSNPSPVPLLLSQQDGQAMHGSGLTTPLSFLGAFSSGGGGSPAWFEGQTTGPGGTGSTGSHTGSSSASGSGGDAGRNSISDALHLLLQGITMPGDDIAVPSVAHSAAQRWSAEKQEH